MDTVAHTCILPSLYFAFTTIASPSIVTIGAIIPENVPSSLVTDVLFTVGTSNPPKPVTKTVSIFVHFPFALIVLLMKQRVSLHPQNSLRFLIMEVIYRFGKIGVALI